MRTTSHRDDRTRNPDEVLVRQLQRIAEDLEAVRWRLDVIAFLMIGLGVLAYVLSR